MSDWSDEIADVLETLGRKAKGAADSVRDVFNDDPYEVLCYRGFGSSSDAWIYGRVVEKIGAGVSTDADSTLRNLLNTYRRADSDPVASATVRIVHGEAQTTMQADDEGFFGGPLGMSAIEGSDEEWREYKTDLVSPSTPDTPVKGSGEILVPSSSAKFGIISDIDDTVIQSRVSSFLQAARTVMLGNARTRLPFPGVSAFYEALRKGATGDEKNPVFFVSSSPWNIHDVIAEFMDLQKIPKGPILLRDWDITMHALSSSRHFDHKGVAIRRIMQMYPHLPFILVGDSSQHDPEIYRQIVSEFPNRVLAIYIRDVTRSAERSATVRKLADEIVAASSTLVLSDDTLGAAKHAAEKGWIDANALADVGEEKRADEGRDDSKEPAPQGGKPGSDKPATVVGEPQLPR